MAMDMRRPSEVGEGFRRRVAEALGPHGFKAGARAAWLARRNGSITHRIEFSASHLNAPGSVTCFVALLYVDRAIRGRSRGWQAGGQLGGPPFAEDPPTNVADSREADALLATIVARIPFFDLLDDSDRICAEVCRRYVPGIVEPSVVVPFVLHRRGPDAAIRYAHALLSGRPELWPAFASDEAQLRSSAPSSVGLGHGTQLRLALSEAGGNLAETLVSPPGTVGSTDLQAANLRSFLGLQLRAWGEPEAAGALRRVGDAEILATYGAQRKLPDAHVLTKSVEAARCALRVAIGQDRAPKRAAPDPELFQYHVLHHPFSTALSPS
jgi:hypothetical protein